MGEQFVTGRTIEEALNAAHEREARGFTFSYDMLGEAATTADDAARYLAEYEHAIHAIGKASHGRGIYEGPGISIKLSALHPRYSADQARARDERTAAARESAGGARQILEIGLNIDAEEADRLELSLDMLEALALDPDLAGWNGLGFVIQAYGKRCPFVIDWLVDLARRVEPAADGSPRQGRLLGYRDQARASRRPRRLSRLHAQGPHRRLLSRLRAEAARRARRGLSAIRHPQRADARFGHRPWRGRTTIAANTSSSACTAWASRCTRKSSAATSSTGRAASMRRSARMRRCSPISCAACSRTAPTPRSSTASPTPAFPSTN